MAAPEGGGWRWEGVGEILIISEPLYYAESALVQRTVSISLRFSLNTDPLLKAFDHTAYQRRLIVFPLEPFRVSTQRFPCTPPAPPFLSEGRSVETLQRCRDQRIATLIYGCSGGQVNTRRNAWLQLRNGRAFLRHSNGWRKWRLTWHNLWCQNGRQMWECEENENLKNCSVENNVLTRTKRDDPLYVSVSTQNSCCFCVPAGSPPRGGDVKFLFDINQPSLPTPFFF